MKAQLNVQIGGAIVSTKHIDKFAEMMMIENGGVKRKCRMCPRTVWRFSADRTRICAMCELGSLPEKLYWARKRGQEDWDEVYG